MSERPKFSQESGEPDSVAPFIEVVESSKLAFRERMRKDIPELERKELEGAIRDSDREIEYFRKISPRIKEGCTVEQIIAEDRENLKAEQQSEQEDRGGTENGITQEAILRLAEVAVQNAREKNAGEKQE